MISFERKIFNQYKKSLLYKIFVVYIIFGLLIFSVNRGEYAYFDLLHYSTNHPFFIALFLLPVTLFAVIFIEHKYYNNYNNLLRIGNRKKIINSNFKLLTTTFFTNIFFQFNLIFILYWSIVDSTIIFNNKIT